MAKFLLVVLTAALLSGEAHAEGVAGGVPPEPEPGALTLAVKKTRRLAYRLAGRVLGTVVAEKMDRSVLRILGRPSSGSGDPRSYFMQYVDLGISVELGRSLNAAGNYVLLPI